MRAACVISTSRSRGRPNGSPNGAPNPPPRPHAHDARTIGASGAWLLRGAAAQRDVAAWAFGWSPAQQTAGTSWMVPFLAGLLDDPYPVVRFNAGRSLRSLPEFADLQYD